MNIVKESLERLRGKDVFARRVGGSVHFLGRLVGVEILDDKFSLETRPSPSAPSVKTLMSELRPLQNCGGQTFRFKDPVSSDLWTITVTAVVQ